MVMTFGVLMKPIVYPSAGDVARVANPIAPPAPGRFWMTILALLPRYFSI
jgi:hypothetical protein